jgi:chaperonin GroES
MTTSFKPVSNYILVKTVEIPNTTPSGLALPEAALDKPNMGTVMAVGEGQFTQNGDRLAVCVQVSDVVLFPKFAGTEVKFNGEKYLIMRDTDLFGVVSNKDN